MAQKKQEGVEGYQLEPLALAILQRRLARGEGRDDSVSSIISDIEFMLQQDIVADIVEVALDWADDSEIRA